MTHRERFHRVMAGESVACVPNYELCLWTQTLDRWREEGMPEGATGGDFFEGAPFFGLERRRFAPVDTAMQPAFPYEVLEDTDRYLVARHPSGILTRALKEGTVRGMRMSMDQYLSFPVTDRASFHDLQRRYDPTTAGRYPANWSDWVREAQASDDPVCLFVNCGLGLYSKLREWAGTEAISCLFCDDPALVEEMLEFWTDFILAVSERALREVQFDFLNFFEDFAGKGGPLLSPATFRRLLLPCYQRIIARFREAGVRHFWLDSDGNVEALIPLVLEAGITCLWPLEQASDMDLARLRRAYGNDLVLGGGIDKRELAKDRSAIDGELSKLPTLLDRGGFFPFLDHAVPPDIPYENFRYYLDRKAALLGHSAPASP